MLLQMALFCSFYGYVIFHWIHVPHLIYPFFCQFSHSVMSDSLRPHGLQHARPPCPSPTPRAYLSSCLSSRWCHPTTSSSLIPFSSCPQSFPASGSFQMSQLFTSGGQSIALSAPTSVPSNEHPGLISFRMDCLENRLRSSHSSGRAAAAAAILHGGNS